MTGGMVEAGKAILIGIAAVGLAWLVVFLTDLWRSRKCR